MVKNIMQTVNANAESNDNGGRQMTEKRRSLPCIVTLPPLKTCTTGARSESLRISLVEDDPAAGVLREGAICDNVSRVIAKGTKSVWTVVGGVAEAAARRTVVSNTTVLRVPRSPLTTVGAFVFQAINMKMPHDMAVKTTSLQSHCGFWAQTGISRCNSSGIRGGSALMKGRTRISRNI